MNIDTTSGDFDFTYLSLGAGVQSSALLVLACEGVDVPVPDVAIFADTGDEPRWVYEYVEILKRWAQDRGVPVDIVRHKSLQRLSSAAIAGVADGTQKFISLPVFVSDGNGSSAPLRRICTKEYKLEPIVRHVRDILGYRPGQRVRHRVRAMLGISIEEIHRMKPNPHPWITNCWPLVDLGQTRQQCKSIVMAEGLPEPQRSACVFCPYHSDEYWSWLRATAPTEFDKAVTFDRRLRGAALQRRGADGVSLNEVPYIHRSLQPLDEVEFKTADPDQTEMWGECEGMCGI